MANKTGAAIKAARTAAGLTQEQLAKKLKGISAADISKAERGEADLTQAVLKEIAKITGVTQASLLNADKKTAEKKTGTGKTSSAKTSSAKTSAAKASEKTTELKLTAAEKELITLYRKADAETKKSVVASLKQKSQSQELIQNLIGSALSSMLSGKK